MPRLSESELRERSYEVEGRTVLIEGAETLLKARALEGIIARALPKEAQPYALRFLECAKPPRSGGAARPNAAEIMAAVQTPAFLSPNSVVVVREIQRLPADEERKLAKWIPNVPRDSLLILVVGEEGAAGKHLPKTVAKEGAAGKHLPKTVAKEGTVVEAARPRGQEIEAWVRREAAALGKEIEPDAAHFLVYERARADLALIRSELGKLALYAADAPRITRRHVEEITPRTIEDRIWDLTDAIGAGSRGDALAILHEMLHDQREPPERLLSNIAGHFRVLWQIKCLLDRGWRPGDKVPEAAAGVLLTGRSSLHRTLSSNPWVVGKTARQASALTWPTLRAALRRLAACDLAIKGIEGGEDKQVALDLLVTTLCARPRRPARA